MSWNNVTYVQKAPTHRPGAGAFLFLRGSQDHLDWYTSTPSIGFRYVTFHPKRVLAMYERLVDPAAVAAANRFFDDLIGLADPEEDLADLRPQVEDFRFEVMTNAGMPSTLNQLRGFIWGLTVARRLSADQCRQLTLRLDKGKDGGWQ